jgi:uncharacterized protein (AIM24 family)
MFCTHCGSELADTAQFCTLCGTQVSPRVQAALHVASPPPPPPTPVAHPVQPAGLPALSSTPARTSKCSWCGAIADATQSSCPQCGATLNMPELVTQSGWIQLPGRKDMAKLRIGNSSCQIEGSYVPVADFNLAAGDSLYFTHHVLLWKDPQTEITTSSLRGGWKRMFAGLPLIMLQAQGPGHIAFSRDAPGEMVALPIHPGQEVDVREHLFLVATSTVTYDWFQTGVWFTTGSGNDTETHYPLGMYMDRFMAPQTPGLLLLHAAGNVFVRELAPNQTILIKPTALIFKDPQVTMHLHFEQPRFGYTGWRSWSNRYLWLRLTGPGRVAAQSVFERIEGESRNLNNFSYATQTQW